MVFFIFVLQAEAKTILISDIDDTLKRSHVLDKSDALLNSQRSNISFAGMSTLLNLIKTDRFFYVSNAPKLLMGDSHSDFLRYNLYPAGKLHLRGSFENDFKVRIISEIIQSEKPDQVILIGDNGENDTLFYAKIENKFKATDIHFFTFIRHAYPQSQFDFEKEGRPPENNQTLFITSGELAVFLMQRGFLNHESLLKVMSASLTPETEVSLEDTDPEIFLPLWMNCSFHTLPNLPESLNNEPVAIELWQKTQYRCHENNVKF